MTAVAQAESIRLMEQRRLDGLKTAEERNRCGQFATPPELSLDVARYAWSRVRHRRGKFCFLDPAVGTGSFYAAFLQAFPESRIEAAVGVELDAAFAEAARRVWGGQGLHLVQGDFTRQEPTPRYNVVLTNPPYVRHHHLPAGDKQRLRELAHRVTGLRLNGLAGLYCYFLLIAHAWLSRHGLAVWLVPSEFMDVNYGREIKRYLTERVSLLHIHRFSPSDVQFDDALVSSAIVVFENRKPQPHHQATFSFGGSLTEPLRSETVALDQLQLTRKWTSLPREHDNLQKTKVLTVGDLFSVKRGLVTGNNGFFILPKSRLQELGIPLSCVRPILPSPRFLKQEIIERDADGWPSLDRQLALIDCRLSEEEICRRWPRFADYLRDGMRRGIHQGYLASRRSPWYSQETRQPARFLCTYMGRSRQRPFRFILNNSEATAANVYLLLYPRPGISRAIEEHSQVVFRALQAIAPEHFFNEGRVYGGGLHKMEPAELMRLPADDVAKVLGVRGEQQRTLF